MTPRPLIPLATCVLAATFLGAARPAAVSAEAVSPHPASPRALILSEAAAPGWRDAPGVFVYTPGTPPSAYQSGPYASPGGSFGASRAAPAAVMGFAAREESSALRAWARPAEWAAQGGAAVLLYGLSRKGRRRRKRRGRKRVGW
jgi:hypothetical protein